MLRSVFSGLGADVIGGGGISSQWGQVYERIYTMNRRRRRGGGAIGWLEDTPNGVSVQLSVR